MFKIPWGQAGRMAHGILWPDISRGCKASPLKRLCTVKDTGDYKARWGVLGNLDSFEGEIFAPTASKKVPWLLCYVYYSWITTSFFYCWASYSSCVWNYRGRIFFHHGHVVYDGLARHLQILWHDCMLFIICMALRIDWDLDLGITRVMVMVGAYAWFFYLGRRIEYSCKRLNILMSGWWYN